jgi:uncharacterized membrane protein YeaQ/YmgE (transglycosylase-associated protein family)
MEVESMTVFEQWSHLILEWIGFGTLAGLLAKAIMPGRDPGGPVANLLMGIGGCVFGLGTISYFWGQKLTPISPMGLLVATVGAFVILGFYKLLAGFFFTEMGSGTGRGGLRPNLRRRGNSVVVVKE